MNLNPRLYPNTRSSRDAITDRCTLACSVCSRWLHSILKHQDSDGEADDRAYPLCNGETVWETAWA